MFEKAELLDDVVSVSVGNMPASPVRRLYSKEEAEQMSKEQRLAAILEFNGMQSPFVRGVLHRRSETVTYVHIDDIHTMHGSKLAPPLTNGMVNKVKILSPTAIMRIPDNCLVKFKITVADNETKPFKSNPFFLWLDDAVAIEALKAVPMADLVTSGDMVALPESVYNHEKSLIEKELKSHSAACETRKAELESEVADLTVRAAALETEVLLKKETLLGLEGTVGDLEQKQMFLSSASRSLAEIAKEKFKVLRSFGLVSEEHYRHLADVPAPSVDEHGETLSWAGDLEHNWFQAVSVIHSYLLEEKKVVYPRWMISNFMTLLRTNDLIVLSCLSGAGKTLLVRRMAEALGGVAHVIPVKPNWTGSEDLLGFFNPLQRTYVKTPFLEALLAASKDKHRLHLICLDEMNLARAEYYFADFLSELEERKSPSVNLYAQSEKEHILSELRMVLKGAGSPELEGLSEAALEAHLKERGQEHLPTVHDQLRRALATVLEIDPVLPIPSNVRFLGTINMDQTTYGFSPKILDRCHIIRFNNPLTFDAEEIRREADDLLDRERFTRLAPIRMDAGDFLPERGDYPDYDHQHPAAKWLQEMYHGYLKGLGIDVAYRTIRQAQAYWDLLADLFPSENRDAIAKSFVFQQKILPKFTMDGKVRITDDRSQSKERWELVKELEQDLEEVGRECGFTPNLYSELHRVRMSADAIERIFNYWAYCRALSCFLATVGILAGSPLF